MSKKNLKNILGQPLQSCCTNPITGFFRDGFCRTDATDRGTHVICAIMTSDFLEFTKSKGNDLSCPRPEYRFSGLVPGNCWCLCALRWLEAYYAGLAPPVNLNATHEKALNIVSKQLLIQYRYDKNS